MNACAGSCLCVLVLALLAGGAVAQTAPSNPAFVPAPPPVQDPGRPGQVVILPGGGMGAVTGGTPYFQMLQTPGGTGGGGTVIMQPNGNGTSTVIDPGGRRGVAPSP